MEVLITAPAEKSLQGIFRFYVDQASEEVASRIVNRIVDRYLTELKQSHRYIIEGNYKIIYLLGLDKVIITDVFDTRQDPDEMIKRAK